MGLDAGDCDGEKWATEAIGDWLPPGVHRLQGAEDRAQAVGVLTRSFVGTSSTAPEGGMDWVMGPLNGDVNDPRRAEILRWLLATCFTDCERASGFALGIRTHEGIGAPLCAAVLVRMFRAFEFHNTPEWVYPIPPLPKINVPSTRRCLEGHVLVPFETARPHYSCDVCGRLCECGCSMLSCRSCNFDMCSECCTERAVRALPAMNDRVQALGSVQIQIHKKYMQGPHLHLMFIGVDPCYQGRRVSSRLLQSVNALADAKALPIYLETQGNRSCAMYRRFGYQVLEEYRVYCPGSCDGTDVLQQLFAMVRPAAANK
jgi:ribosomal protein S18 acetylase RimI-like enzyme|eukprot:TRINITY_DN50757_c0_g1_i1.p1 TRINITY_DN50757_c0_g1~~TRINITY_DN50757_c0_g1_i1.p1  ORF type:complete len:316 (+),score=23.25 TRINITY_DN50757_c0_g1_i1:119-1066(+)